jgi:hypothetical protein
MSVRLGPAFLYALGGGFVAGLLNLALLLGASAAGAPARGAINGPGTEAVDLPVIMGLVGSVGPAIPAWIVFAILTKVTPKYATVFTGVAAAFLLLSMGGPATLEAASTSTKLLLAFMHVPPAIGIVAGLLRGARST